MLVGPRIKIVVVVGVVGVVGVRAHLSLFHRFWVLWAEEGEFFRREGLRRWKLLPGDSIVRV